MPALGQTSDELRLLNWLKPEGAAVKEGEPLLVIETDKATLEVEASASGTLLRALVSAGETVDAGTLLGWIGAPGDAIPAGYEPALGAAAAAEAAIAPQASTGPAAPARPPRARPPGHRVLATPSARMLARELGIDLSLVAGTGPEGRIERRDVESLGETKQPGR
jgi:pyruvate dehydrogenase E2 component (dihydrolipoamide acetyltransferase)